MKRNAFAAVLLSLSLSLSLSLALSGCGGGGGGGGGSATTYSLSGVVTLNGAGYPGVTVALSGDSSGSTTTDSLGNYAFTDLVEGEYTLTPSLASQALTPASRPIPLSGSITGADFALVTYSISGNVLLNGGAYSGATIALSGSATASTVTVAGSYSFPGLLNGSYTLTPAVAGQSLSPNSINLTVSGGNAAGNNFALNTFSISGRVTGRGAGIGSAFVEIS